MSPPQNDGAQDTRSTSPLSTTTREERSEQGSSSSSNTAGDQDGGDGETQFCLRCDEEYPRKEFHPYVCAQCDQVRGSHRLCYPWFR